MATFPKKRPKQEGDSSAESLSAFKQELVDKQLNKIREGVDARLALIDDIREENDITTADLQDKPTGGFAALKEEGASSNDFALAVLNTEIISAEQALALKNEMDEESETV